MILGMIPSYPTVQVALRKHFEQLNNVVEIRIGLLIGSILELVCFSKMAFWRYETTFTNRP
eukprot:6180296-Pleurochrysis_carterae.AAC.1